MTDNATAEKRIMLPDSTSLADAGKLMSRLGRTGLNLNPRIVHRETRGHGVPDVFEIHVTIPLDDAAIAYDVGQLMGRERLTLRTIRRDDDA